MKSLLHKRGGGHFQHYRSRAFSLQETTHFLFSEIVIRRSKALLSFEKRQIFKYAVSFEIQEIVCLNMNS